MIEANLDRYWRDLYSAGLLDLLRPEDTSLSMEPSTVKHLTLRSGGVGNRNTDTHKYLPRVSIAKFKRLLEIVSRDKPNQHDLDALAAVYVIGIASPAVRDLAHFCSTYTMNKNPNKQRMLKRIINHMQSVISEIQERAKPYPYLNHNAWQKRMQADFHTLSTSEPVKRGTVKVPAGYPCIVRCSRSGESLSFRSASILVNGVALAFTVPWVHTCSTLPRGFDTQGVRAGNGLFGILSVSSADLESIYQIGKGKIADWIDSNPRLAPLRLALAESKSALANFPPAKVESAQKAAKAGNQKAQEYLDRYAVLTEKAAKLSATLEHKIQKIHKDSPFQRMAFYPLDILNCKVLEAEVTLPVPLDFTAVYRSLAPLRKATGLESTTTLTVDNQRERKWKLTVE